LNLPAPEISESAATPKAADDTIHVYLAFPVANEHQSRTARLAVVMLFHALIVPALGWGVGKRDEYLNPTPSHGFASNGHHSSALP
jgi:hypothetical protein